MINHESTGLRVTGNVYLRLLDHTQQPVIGPLPAEYIGASPKTDVATVTDTRLGRRGQVLFAVSNPKEPSGKLTLLSAPRKVIAMALLGNSVTGAAQAATASVVDEEYTFAAAPATKQLNAKNVSSVTIKSADGQTTYASPTDYTVSAAAGTITTVDTAGMEDAGTYLVSYTYSTAVESHAFTADYGVRCNKRNIDNIVVKVGGATKTLGTDYEIISEREGIVRPLATGTMGASGTCTIEYTFGGITEESVTLGSSNTLHAKVTLDGINDVDPDGGLVRWECADAILTPNGDINLVGKDPIKVEFNLMPQGSGTKLSFPTYTQHT